MIVLESIIAAVIPAALYVAFIYFIDRYEREPLWLVGATFLWGAIPSILLALIFNGIFGLPLYVALGDSMGDMATAVLIAPPVEEVVKGLALLLLFLFWRHEIDSPLDGIIYGAMVGMGFAMVENVFYFLDQYAVGGREAWQLNIFMRAVVFGLNHAMYTAMTGLGIAVARLTAKRWVRIVTPLAGLFVAIAVHFLHNLFASAAEVVGPVACIPLLANAWGGLFITAVIVVWSIWQEHTWIKKYLFEEVSLGVLTPEQYVAVSAGWRRWLHRVQLLFTKGPRASRHADKFYIRASELAYSKHHYRYTPDGPTHQRIIDLRQEVMRLGQEMF